MMKRKEKENKKNESKGEELSLFPKLIS